MKEIRPTIEAQFGEYGDRVIHVTLGPLNFEWFDNSNIDCPEDLCWHRMIGNVFDAGFRMGHLAARMEAEEEREENIEEKGRHWPA